MVTGCTKATCADYHDPSCWTPPPDAGDADGSTDGSADGSTDAGGGSDADGAAETGAGDS